MRNAKFAILEPELELVPSLRCVKLLDLTLCHPAANLACDEALLDACEDDLAPEVLRFWEPKDWFVVVGYANHVNREVNLQTCARENISIYRRCSGGGTILQGPGCLNYSLILRMDGNHPLQTITAANCYIMERHRQALAGALRLPVCVRGITDLALGERKFSGNAQRRKRKALIFHGTFLLGLDMAKVQTFLTMPSRQPDYRQGRNHQEFMMNLDAPPGAIKAALREAWVANEILPDAPDFSALLEEKYSTQQWNLKY
jgi:lipoate---protein ligase